MTPARFRWGMLLIQIGILILLINNDKLSDDVWDSLVNFFPLVLIAVGVEKIFTKGKLQFIAYLTTFVLFFGGFAIAYNTSDGRFQDGEFTSGSIYIKEAKPDLRLIKAKLQLEHNDLTIRDAGSDLIEAEFDESSKKPLIETNFDDDVAHFYMKAQEKSYFGGVVKINTGDVQDWKIRFSEDLPLELECYGYDNDFRLNFQFSRLQKLRLDTENTSIYLKIGFNEPYVQVIVKGEDSKMRLRVPEKCGVKVICTDAEYFLKLGLTETKDGDFVNDNYYDAEKKIDIEVDDRLLSFSLDYY